MGRAFRMSDKKLQQERQEEERRIAVEKKQRAQLYSPLFGKPTKPVKLKPAAAIPQPAPVSKKSSAAGMMGIAAKAPAKVYTGDKVLGIAVMHKSNLVPIFNDEAARDVSKMRRG